MALGPNDLQTLLDNILAQARTVVSGADVAVSLFSGRAANTRFARHQITSTGDVDETTVTVGVAFGKRSAAVTTNQTDPTSLRTAIANAARLAQIAPADPERMPPL